MGGKSATFLARLSRRQGTLYREEGCAVGDIGGIPFALTRKNKHQKLVEAYNEAKAEMMSPDAKFCDDPNKLKRIYTGQF